MIGIRLTWSIKGPIVNYVPGGGGGGQWFSKKCSVSKLNTPRNFEVKIIPPPFPILV